MYLFDVRHTSPAVAIANIFSCDSDGNVCQNVVLLTVDGWQHQTGLVLSGGNPYGVSVDVLPEGSAAIIPNLLEHKHATPFILHASGDITALKLSTAASGPRRGAVLVSRPASAPPRPRSGAIWIVGPHRHVLHPARRQPCACSGWGTDATLLQRESGTVFSAVLDGLARQPNRWFDLRVSHDGGRSWTGANRAPAHFGPYNSGFAEISLTREPHIVAAWTSDVGTDYARFRPWVSHDGGRTWLRIDSHNMGRALGGVAVLKGGRALFAVNRRLWSLPSGATTPRPIPGPPLKPLELYDSGGVVVASSGKRGIAVSADGRHWRTFTLGDPLTTNTSRT